MTGAIFVTSARKLSSSGYILSSIPHWVTLKRVWNILDPRIRKFLCLPHWLHEFTILSLVLFDKSSYRERKRSWNSKKVKECHCILSYTVIYAANSHTYYYRYSITHSHFHSISCHNVFCLNAPSGVLGGGIRGYTAYTNLRGFFWQRILTSVIINKQGTFRPVATPLCVYPLEVCGNRFFVPIPSHFNDVIPIPIPFPFPSET